MFLGLTYVQLILTYVAIWLSIYIIVDRICKCKETISLNSGISKVATALDKDSIKELINKKG